MQINGIININKEKGYTSHDVVAIVRRTLDTRKVGHTGTLDPDATGVLPICVGNATKAADYIQAKEKGYIAEITLGITTDTADASGKILERKEVNKTENEIIEAFKSFEKTYEQTPPMYSAIKVNGKKLYDLAREGVVVERKKRLVTISKIDIMSICNENVKIFVACSKGTYIRSLATDAGDLLKCGAHIKNLERTYSGNFKIEDSITLDNLKLLKEQGRLSEIMMPTENAFTDYKSIKLTEKSNKFLYNGNMIFNSSLSNEADPFAEGERLLVFDSKNEFIGIYEIIIQNREKRLKPYLFLYKNEATFK